MNQTAFSDFLRIELCKKTFANLLTAIKQEYIALYDTAQDKSQTETTRRMAYEAIEQWWIDNGFSSIRSHHLHPYAIQDKLRNKQQIDMYYETGFNKAEYARFMEQLGECS